MWQVGLHFLSFLSGHAEAAAWFHAQTHSQESCIDTFAGNLHRHACRKPAQTRLQKTWDVGNAAMGDHTEALRQDQPPSGLRAFEQRGLLQLLMFTSASQPTAGLY